jgi:hypothetical protein
VLSLANIVVLGTVQIQFELDHDKPVEVSFIRNLTVFEPEAFSEKL